MPCGWEGNRRSGVALAMRHRRPRQGDEHPAYALLVEYGPFTFTLINGTQPSLTDCDTHNIYSLLTRTEKFRKLFLPYCLNH